MNYQAQIEAYLSANQPNYGVDSIGSILEFLFWNYTEYNPIYDETIRGEFRELHELFSYLTPQQEDRVFNVITDLCLKHQQLAFREGFRVGLRMAEELRGIGSCP
ncbi:MAG: hypothetical protein J6J12_08930 [Oscillospiraceae bacterium]|nr:hypothetical protein [Oscillospiraceae bacterium]MBP3685065.1 hypothetical protein [Oscillospiraceae bacterium]